MPKIKESPERQDKINKIIKALKLKPWMIKAKDNERQDSKRQELTLYGFKIEIDRITLGDVLEYIRKKFRLKTLTPQITQTVAMWRFKHDDLFEQWNYCIDWIYYLVMVKKPKYDKRNANQKEGVE